MSESQQLKMCPECSTQTTSDYCPKCNFEMEHAEFNNQPAWSQLDKILELAKTETDPANRRTLILAVGRILENLVGRPDSN